MTSRRFRPLGALMAVGLLFGSASADEPVQTPAPHVRSEGAEAIHAPSGPASSVVDADRGLRPPLVPITLPPEPGRHRGGILTDAGAGLAPSAPTNHELAKLAMALEAVEAARAAGTLHGMPVAAPTASLPLVAPGGSKATSPAGRPPLVLAPDPAAGVGEHPFVQEVGPPGPTEPELAKLRAHRENGGPQR